MHSDTPKLIFANTVNELMVASPSHDYAQGLWAVTPRKMWLAYEGDIVLTPRPIPPAFKAYSCSVLDVRADRIATLSPASESVALLPLAVRRNGVYAELAAAVQTRPNLLVKPFALDRPTLALVRDLGIPLEGYRTVPDEAITSALYELNTKSGFRRLAEDIGLRVPPGRACGDLPGVMDAIVELMPIAGQVIVKLDRSSNGYGHTILDSALGLDAIRAHVEQMLRRVGEQPSGFVVEAFLPFVSVPSVEVTVDDSGPQILYSCDQRCRNASFTGMVTPPISLSQAGTKELERAGLAFGERLFLLGIRGVCDVDGGLTATGDLYFTETNLRRTGGTYLDTLMRRLVGDDYLQTHVWIADARLGNGRLDFAAGVVTTADAGLAFDRSTGTGVVFTSDTVDVDGRWRYLIAARTLAAAEQSESRLEALLQLAPVP